MQTNSLYVADDILRENVFKRAVNMGRRTYYVNVYLDRYGIVSYGYPYDTRMAARRASVCRTRHRIYLVAVTVR